jgi:hypothetical protein
MPRQRDEQVTVSSPWTETEHLQRKLDKLEDKLTRQRMLLKNALALIDALQREMKALEARRLVPKGDRLLHVDEKRVMPVPLVPAMATSIADEYASTSPIAQQRTHQRASFNDTSSKWMSVTSDEKSSSILIRDLRLCIDRLSAIKVEATTKGRLGESITPTYTSPMGDGHSDHSKEHLLHSQAFVSRHSDLPAPLDASSPIKASTVYPQSEHVGYADRYFKSLPLYPATTEKKPGHFHIVPETATAKTSLMMDMQPGQATCMPGERHATTATSPSLHIGSPLPKVSALPFPIDDTFPKAATAAAAFSPTTVTLSPLAMGGSFPLSAVRLSSLERELLQRLLQFPP